MGSERYTKVGMPTTEGIDILYYDGRCAMCSREIAFLKRHADEHLCFQDIHIGNLPADVTKQQALEVLHLRSADGAWHKGINATLGAWSHTRYKWVVSPLRVSWLRPLFDRLYAAWANRRYCRLYQKADGSPQDSHV
ncbi:DUF393 domain-containing protein [Corallincola platygyrae]|uniref:DUF393 domain-containing protein n=1 Tax=Corallincola platygyrae TaxID=1193278 RepID=A0ABW4XGH7_9GAMM